VSPAPGDQVLNAALGPFAASLTVWVTSLHAASPTASQMIEASRSMAISW
jgi:hypothetical protein